MIIIKETRVKNFIELHNALNNYSKSTSWLFRGHSNPDWNLVPKAGREPFKQYNDVTNFQSWKRRAIEFINETNNVWDLLAIAQHHGFATRLLDWTFNPLVAAFFAVQNHEENDAIIYAYLNNVTLETEGKNPFEPEGINKIKPNASTERIIRQSGIFTIHNPPDLNLEENLNENQKLEKIIIDSSYRKQLKFDLSYYGINQLSLFPGLDGLSGFMNWFTENIEYWSTNSTQKELMTK